MNATALLITAQAHDAIARAVVDSQGRGCELGGSLLALEGAGTTLVAYALPTGPGADQGWGHLKTDAEFQNRTIAVLQARYSELSYVGDWHVHPMWLPELSATDRRTARTILREEARSRDHLVLLLGTSAPGEDPVVLGFRAAIDTRGLAIESVPLRRVADDASEVTSRLGHALSPMEELLVSKPAEISVREHAAIHRVEADLERVRAELGAEATLWLAGATLGAVVQRGQRGAVVLFPPEYPLGAPQVFSGSLEQGSLRAVPLRYGWSSLHHVTDVVAEALARDVAVRSAPRSLSLAIPSPARWPIALLRAALAWAGVLPSPRRPAPRTGQEETRLS